MALRVFTVIGRQDLADDPGYYSPAGRLARGDEVDRAVADWVADRTTAQVMAAFQANDCAIAHVYDAEALLDDPHLAARGTFAPVDDPDLGPVRVQAPTARLSGTPGATVHLGRAIGADNDEVYRGLLGFDEARMAALRAHRTI